MKKIKNFLIILLMLVFMLKFEIASTATTVTISENATEDTTGIGESIDEESDDWDDEDWDDDDWDGSDFDDDDWSDDDDWDDEDLDTDDYESPDEEADDNESSVGQPLSTINNGSSSSNNTSTPTSNLPATGSNPIIYVLLGSGIIAVVIFIIKMRQYKEIQ